MGELSTPPLPLPASNTVPPVLLPMVSLNSTKDLLMLNPRLMLMPPLMLTTDTTAVDTDTDTDTVMAVTTVMADTDLDMDMVDTAVTTVRFHGYVIMMALKKTMARTQPLFPPADDFESFGFFVNN